MFSSLRCCVASATAQLHLYRLIPGRFEIFQAIINDVLISGFAAGFKLGTHFELLIEYNVLYMLTEINFVDRTVLYMIDNPPLNKSLGTASSLAAFTSSTE